MTHAAPEDAASVLEQFVHDVANTPAEVTHLLEEIAAKDLQISAFRDEITKRDNQLQKWVRVNGGHVLNPKEDAFSKTINDCYDKCEILQAEKCGLGEKALIVLERQLKRLDAGLRGLAVREEFPADWGGPSLLSASGSATAVGTPVPGPLQAVSGNVAPNLAQLRLAAQAAGGGSRSGGGSGAQTPANPPRNQREGSSEANKRRRLNASLSSLPAAGSSLRQSSLGPGTPKAGTPVPTTGGGGGGSATGTGTSRAGSQQPARPSAGHKKGSSSTTAAGGPPQGAANRKLAPPPRKRDRTRNTKKSSHRNRHLKSERATPSTNASLSSSDSESGSPTPSSLPRSQADGAADRGASDDEEEEDTGPYCTCQRGSFGEMVCCDNDDCPWQWFHFECVGMKHQPEGEWLCRSCSKLPREKIVKGSQ